MNRIILSTIDLTDFRASFSETYTIPFDNSLRNVSGVTDAKVDVEVVGLTTKNFTLKNISVTNVPEGVEATILSGSLDVVIRGTEEQLGELAAENIRAVADLVDYKESTGPFVVPAKIYVDGFVDVGAVGDYQISVNLAR